MKNKPKHKPIRTLREAERWIRDKGGYLCMGRPSMYRWEANVIVDGVLEVAHGKSATDAVDRLAWKLERE